MTELCDQSANSDRIEAQAASWIWRLERGLAPEEQDEFFDWLSADPSHVEVLACHRRAWKQLDRLADWRPEHATRPNPDLLAPRRKPWWRTQRFVMPMAAAAAVALGIGLWSHASTFREGAGAELPAMKHENRQVLADGSFVKLNGNADVTVQFSGAERRVRLNRGEGFFIVAKDPARPFVVEVHGIEIRAVGTAFNVNVEAEAVDVLVAEGTVRVEPSVADDEEPAGTPVSAPTAVTASQRASIPLRPQASPLQVSMLTRQEVKRVLAWQHGMMTFDKRSLAGIVAELNLLNDRQLVISDPTVAAMQFSGTIRSDNIDGFVRLLESGFRVRGEADGPNRIILRSP